MDNVWHQPEKMTEGGLTLRPLRFEDAADYLRAAHEGGVADEVLPTWGSPRPRTWRRHRR